ncbi:MAG: phosphotransferase [Candidatus Aquirickettsiella sp.]
MLKTLTKSILEKDQQLHEILIYLENEKEETPAIVTVLYNKKILIKLLKLKITQAANFSEITGGYSNETYHYFPDKLVLRFSRLGNPYHCNQSAEVRNILQANLFDLTPLIVAANYAKHHVLVTHFIPHCQLYPLEIFQRPSKLIALANLVKNLHYSQSYFNENSESAISFVDKLSPSFQNIKATLSKEDYFILERLNVLRKVLEKLKIFKRASHGDLHHFNLIEVAGTMQLIDWELSSIADPAYDIARLFSVDNFNAEQKEIFINAYKNAFDIFLSEETIKHLTERIQLFEPLNHFSIVVWSKHTSQFCNSEKRKILNETITHYTKKTLTALHDINLPLIKAQQDTVKSLEGHHEFTYPSSYFSLFRLTHENEPHITSACKPAKQA